VQDGDIICVNCGTNLLTGQKITEEKKVLARQRRSIPLWVWIAIILGALLILAVVALMLMPRASAVARARDLIEDNQISKATALLNEHVKEHPEDPEAQFLLGRLHWTANQYPQAGQAFREAAKRDTANRDAFMLSAVAYASANDANSRNLAVQVLQEMVKAFPNDQEAFLLLGMARGAMGDHEGQIQALKSALNIAPTMQEGREYLGLALAAKGLLPEAREQLNTAMQAAPENSDLKAAQAFVSAGLGDKQASEDLLREAVRSNTSIQDIARAQLGITLVGQGRFQEALEYLQPAQASGTATDTAKLFYGVAQAALGNTDAAISALNELALKKDSPIAIQANVLIAQSLLNSGDLPRAQEAIGRAVAAKGTGPLLYTTKGRIEVVAGQDAEARESFKNAIQADPNYPPAHLEYGLFFITREQSFDEGIRHLEKYLELLEPAEREAYAKPIESLVSQLKQTGGQAPAAPEAPETTSGIVS
jgi:tetratricopeptide (TPR) repeat protein